MKKNLLFLFTFPFLLNFNAIKSNQKLTKKSNSNLAKEIAFASVIGILSGEMHAQLNNYCDGNMPSTNYAAGRIMIDLPFSNILNACTKNPRKIFINASYLIASTISYYTSPYVHDAIESALVLS